jgi:Fe-S cluster assembly protein SufD
MTKDRAAGRFAEQYQALKGALPGAAQPWLAALREAGLQRFAARGLPTVRDEDWKYTNLAPLQSLELEPAAPAAGRGVALPDPIAGADGPHVRLVFHDGRLWRELSQTAELPQGVRLESLAELADADAATLQNVLSEEDAFAGRPMLALNTALMGDGYVLRLDPGATVEPLIEIVHVTTDEARPWVAHPRNVIHAAANSAVTVVERHLGGDGEGAYLINGVTELVLEDGARVRHVKVQSEGLSAFHIAQVRARLARDARFESFVLTSGGRLSRHDIHVRLEGPGAECRLNGITMQRDGQLTDNTIVVEHAAPHTTSRQIYKGALDGKARGVFQGRIVVHPGAQKTDGHQSCKTLLLSDRAEIDAKPELEIYADDVKCSHGAVAGELEESALFYLRARGIPERAARNLLVEGFLGEVVDGLSVAVLHEPLKAVVAEWLAAGGDER